MSEVTRWICFCLLLDAYQSAPIAFGGGNGESVDTLLSNIRGSWGPPFPYLEKRGYMEDQQQMGNYADLYRHKDDFLGGLKDQNNVLPRQASAIQPVHYNDREVNRPSLDDWNQLGEYMEDPYIGEHLFNKIKQKWNKFWHNETVHPDTPQSIIVPKPTTVRTTSTTQRTITTTPPKVGTRTNPFFYQLNRPAELQQAEIHYLDGIAAQGAPIANKSNAMLLETTNLPQTPPTPKYTIPSKPTEEVIMPNIQESDLNYMRKYVACNNQSTNINLTRSAKNSEKYLDTKLRFLANSHHSVYNVGVTKPDRRLDLNAVQDQIDDAKITYNLNEAAAVKTSLTANSKPNDQHTKEKKSAPPGNLWWPLGVQVSKRSVSSDPESTYHNDYLDSFDINNSEGSHDQYELDYEDNDNEINDVHPGEESANLFGWFHRRKHKKHRRKHHKKHHSYLMDDGNIDDMNMIKKENYDDFADFSDIQDRIHPEQQKDIAKFIRNVKAEPQRFDFDVDSFVANYKAPENINKMSPEIELVTDKSFYEFSPEAEPNISNVTEFQSRRLRRDILTQHLKAIANKIQLYPPFNDNNMFEWTHSSDNKESKQVEAAEYTMGNTGDEEDNRYIDNYYLLNDGKQMFDNLPTKDSALSQLNMDLELDRKFRDLNTAKDETYYAIQAEQEAIANKNI